MTSTRLYWRGEREVTIRQTLSRASMLACRVAVLLGATMTPAPAAQHAPPVTSVLVFDNVTVVDVDQGKLVPAQRVVIAGNRVQTVGPVKQVPISQSAQVIDARGKYLIPGLWDLHTHAMHQTDLFYPLFLANGVTGIRDAGSSVPLDTLIRWRQEILAGTRVGPPRQLLSGPAVNVAWSRPCRPSTHGHQICTPDSAGVRQVVDSLKAAGADMIKPYNTRDMYFAIAAEARRVGIPFGGHLQGAIARASSDSGARIIDHIGLPKTVELDQICGGHTAKVAECGALAERFRRNGTWVAATLNNFRNSLGVTSKRIRDYYKDQVAAKFWAGSLPRGNWLREAAGVPAADSTGYLTVAHQVGLPILAATDASAVTDCEVRQKPPGFVLHVELAILVAEGLSPVEALRAATLNPAKMWGATDSLGTVAPGKLADLVLLAEDPLADITNTTTVQAVVANGRYFDRAALNGLLTEAQAIGFKRLREVKVGTLGCPL